MQKMTYIIRDKNGLHARPAGLIVQAAKGYKSKVSISAGEKSADCKKLFQVMGLGRGRGESGRRHRKNNARRRVIGAEV